MNHFLIGQQQCVHPSTKYQKTYDWKPLKGNIGKYLFVAYINFYTSQAFCIDVCINPLKLPNQLTKHYYTEEKRLKVGFPIGNVLACRA